MMPLIYASPGEENIIKKVGGNPDVKRHLENLGLTPGGTATLVNVMGGNVIVKVKESRIAIDKEMAKKVMI
ncbi:MAG: ferrous iron transport protein A [Lachnospiraceae bacterium]|jgi:ferrous iron transport protein A|nr:ferrous iron transport protein A [Lachnospiraceae bacterium]MBQ9390989.1 ferrous iron transport protein A [Lachnospiraceae bacterium]